MTIPTLEQKLNFRWRQWGMLIIGMMLLLPDISVYAGSIRGAFVVDLTDPNAAKKTQEFYCAAVGPDGGVIGADWLGMGDPTATINFEYDCSAAEEAEGSKMFTIECTDVDTGEIAATADYEGFCLGCPDPYVSNASECSADQCARELDAVPVGDAGLTKTGCFECLLRIPPVCSNGTTPENDPAACPGGELTESTLCGSKASEIVLPVCPAGAVEVTENGGSPAYCCNCSNLTDCPNFESCVTDGCLLNKPESADCSVNICRYTACESTMSSLCQGGASTCSTT